MSNIAAPQRQAIEEIVGTDRARFDKRERRIYSHDTGVLQGHFGCWLDQAWRMVSPSPKQRTNWCDWCVTRQPTVFPWCRAARRAQAMAEQCPRTVDWC